MLTGRALADVATNIVQLAVLLGAGIAAGFWFKAGVGEVLAGIALMLLFGYAFSWFFAWVGLTASSRSPPRRSASR